MVRFWFKEGQPTLTVEGAPLELGPTSLVLLYRLQSLKFLVLL